MRRVLRYFSVKKLVLTAFFLLVVTLVGLHFGEYTASDFKSKILSYFRYRTYEASSILPEDVEAEVDEDLGYRLPGKKALLPGAKWVPQTFNNCGPATTSMMLQYFGYSVSQEETKTALRTNPTDSNVFTYEMAEYLRKFGIESRLLYNGNIELLKTLVTNGFYVVLEDWLHPNEDIGHVTIIRGFDDEKGVLIADDSYIGVNVTYKYEELEETQWKAFNWEYLPVYKKENEELVKRIVGEDWDREEMYQALVTRNGKLTVQNPKDLYAWFNLGNAYFALGELDKAKLAFERSRSLGWPRRMLWYQYQPIQVYNQLGEYEKALELIATGLASNDSYAELHYEAAVAYKGLGDLGKAKEEANKAFQYAPNYSPAKELLKDL